MDAKLAHGIELADSQINQPSLQDKSTFVAQLLVTALMHENDAHAAISCAWLATRCPDLKQVQAEQKEERLTYSKVDNEDASNYDFGIGGSGATVGEDAKMWALGIVQWF